MLFQASFYLEKMKSPLCPMSVPGSAGSAGSLLATMVVEMKILLLILLGLLRDWMELGRGFSK